MLRQIDKNLWLAEQPFKYFGLSVGTRMTVIRLTNGDLVVISPLQATDTLVHQLNQIGTVSHLIAPNLYHYLFTANFKAVYPQATFWAAPGLDTKKPELLIDKIISQHGIVLFNELEYLLFDGLKTLSLTGVDLLNECVFFHRESRTLILTDTAFHFDDSFPRTTQLVTRFLGGYKRLSPSLLERLASGDKEKVKQSVEKVLLWDFERVIVAHGSVIERNGKQMFQAGYQQFLGI